MAININAPKNRLLMPFFIVLVIIAIPFALFFSLIRLPFAKRRIKKLPDILKNDWLPRKKYIYIGINGKSALSNFVREEIIGQYGEYIVWDEWNEAQSKWISSEPDNMKRITTFWQDIGEDFDGEPMIIIATYKPDDFVVSWNNNFHLLSIDENDGINYDAEENDAAQKKIKQIVADSLGAWIK